MKIKSIVSRYLRNVQTDQIKHLDDGVSEWVIDGIKLYINRHICQSNLGIRYFITDRGNILKDIKVEFKKFHRIMVVTKNKISEDGVLSNITSGLCYSELNSLTMDIERFVNMIQIVKEILNE